jgi:hypothetical protein
MTEPLVSGPQAAEKVGMRGPSGHLYPAFGVPGMLVRSFTGGLPAVLLMMGGWARSWGPAVEYDLDIAWRPAERTEVIR